MKLKMLSLMLMLILFIFSSNLVAGDVCTSKVTPEIYHGYKIPKQFSKSNNLRRMTGSPVPAEGKMILIFGKVTDKNCVPIQNAVISIWHLNAYGEYQYDGVDYNGSNVDENFVGTGSTFTDNLGNYNFITIFPADYTNEEPFINFIVNHDDFIPFETRAFFSNRNKQLKEFDPEIANRLIVSKKSSYEYQYNITLNGSNLYRQY